ncbi:hypothetical protein BS78_09G092200 [Paspalum vaginatum]|nr:hypothetical protein BS78_09G092200 [Paspalum vaginatum]
MNHSMLKVVTTESQNWTVRVRVVRFVRSRSIQDPSKPGRLDFILLDAEGTTMEGNILENRIERFSKRFKEDSIYYIRYFQVMSARVQYKLVDHPCMASFTKHTELYEINLVPEGFPLYACMIVPFEILHARSGTNEYCSDTIGIFKGCTQVRSQNTRKGVKSLRSIYITDGKEDVTVTLWGDAAEQFDATKYIEMGKTKPVILLFVAVTSAVFDSKLVMQGSLLFKCYANPDLPEVTSLRDSCFGRVAAPIWHGPTIKETTSQRISVAELSEFTNPHTIYNNKYIINAKIKGVVPNKSWWYLACELCNKRLKEIDGALKCTRVNCLGKSGSPSGRNYWGSCETAHQVYQWNRNVSTKRDYRFIWQTVRIKNQCLTLLTPTR